MDFTYTIPLGILWNVQIIHFYNTYKQLHPFVLSVDELLTDDNKKHYQIAFLWKFSFE